MPESPHLAPGFVADAVAECLHPPAEDGMARTMMVVVGGYLRKIQAPSRHCANRTVRW